MHRGLFFIGISFFCLPSFSWAADLSLKKTVRKLSDEIAAQLPKQSKVLVSDFFDRDDRITYFGRYLSDKLQTALVGQPGIVVVERRRLPLILEELKIQRTGLVNEATAIKMGRMLGADTMVYGTVTDLENSIDIDVKVLSIETSRIIGGATQRLKKTDALANLLRSIILSERGKLANERGKLVKETTGSRRRIAALEAETKQLRQALLKGVWRDGPTFEEDARVPIERGGIGENTLGLWLMAGLMQQNQIARTGWNAGLGLRTPSGRWELGFDVGAFSRKNAGRVLPQSPSLHYTYELNVLVYRLRAGYIHKLRFLRVPGVVRFRFPGSLRIGAGLATYNLKETFDVGQLGALPPPPVHAVNKMSRTEPMIDLAINRTFSNVFDLQLAAEYVFSRGVVGPTEWDYGGYSFFLRLAYRLF